MTTTRERLSLGALHQLRAQPTAAERLRHEQQLDEEPVVRCFSPQSPRHASFGVVDGDDQWPIIASSCFRLVVRHKWTQNPVAACVVGNVGYAEAKVILLHGVTNPTLLRPSRRHIRL